MKPLFLFTVLFFGSVSHAVTRAHFLIGQGMIQLLPSDYFGGSDPDSAKLYEAMNVPAQGSLLGPGKKIGTDDKILNLICAQQAKGDQCTILLNMSPAVQIDPAQKKIQYEITGAPADQLRQQFHLDEKSEFHFITTDGLFRLDIIPQKFRMLYNESGVETISSL